MGHKKRTSWRGVAKIALRQVTGRTDRNGLIANLWFQIPFGPPSIRLLAAVVAN